MESSLRGDLDEATKGVDSFLDGANMSLASFEPSIQITTDTGIEHSVPVNEVVKGTPGDRFNESETRTPPLTVADLAAPPQKPSLTDDEIDNSPLARQTAARRQPVSVIRRRRSSHGIGSLRPGSPSKSSMFQTPAAIRSTMNRLPTETAISQRIRDVEVPPSVMKELESDKRLLGLNERNDKSGVLTLREQGALIDKLRKENFGLKIKVFYLEGKINQQYDEAARDVMKEVLSSKFLF